MYTQCPDCEIAFKVTADVLKQAAGMVRCGSCGHAFNALAYLSEQMPRQPKRYEASEALPELKPEIIDTDDGLPQTISAAQSAALLKTLDELAGSNIRIEDTGVEWRVLDEADAAAPAADDDDAGNDFDSGITNVDEYLDDTDTPIDEFLTATPEVVEAPEIFAAAANPGSRAVVDELRFDDDTPLPDDFDMESAAPYVSAPEPAPQASAEDDVDEDEQSEAADFALSEPDEWTDILGEFQDLAADLASPSDVSTDEGPADEEEPDVVAAIDAIDSSNDVPLDMDAQFALQAEAMGIDLSGIEVLESEDEPEEAFELELDDELSEEPDDDWDEELDEDLVLDDDPELESGDELEDELDLAFELDSEDELETEIDAIDATRDEEFDREIEQLDLIVDEDDYIDEPIVEQHTIENELETALAESDSAEEDSADPVNPFYLPAMTEEEHTVNMMIDQDLMSLAIEDEDGFASTIVIPDKDAEKKVQADKAAEADPDSSDDDESDEAPGFETIIMEGEFVRSAFDSKKLKADAAAAMKLAKIKRAGEAEKEVRAGGTRWGMVAGLVLLVLVLAVQAMHQSREALATLPAFSNTVGQVYRALGQPVQPAWDITGWRFEATKGSAEGEAGELTIYSRLGNKSDGPLPYPLIGISLTDRFEETIGSRVLDPAEYLPTDLDPRKLVPPGNTFNAVITIDSTTENATGFKLNVCYRLSDGQLRCAIDDFK